MGPGNRRWARVGLIAYTTAGAGVAWVALAGPPQIVTTLFGRQPAVPAWVPVVAYLGLAVAAGSLVRSSLAPRWRRIVVGLVLAFVALGLIESIRPLQAGLGPLGPLFTIGRVLAWIGLAAGIAVLSGGTDRTHQTRGSSVASAGFGMVLLAHLAVTAGTATLLPDQVGAVLTQGLQTWAIPLSSWLIFFVAWQVIEGMHASEDLGLGVMGKVRPSQLTALVVAKTVLVVVALALFSWATSAGWADARAARPIAWAIAAVVAAAIILAITDDRPVPVDKRSAALAAVAVVALWQAPYLIGISLVGLGWVAATALPSSPGDMVGLLFLVIAVVMLRSWIQDALPGRPWQMLTLAGLIAASVVGPTSARWFSDIEAIVVSTIRSWTDGLIELAMPWAAWSLSLLPLVAGAWMLSRRRVTPTALAVLVVGLALLPRSIGVLGREVLGLELPFGSSPNLVMVDGALTVLVLWRLLTARGRRALRPATTHRLGVAVAVVTLVAYGSQIAGVAGDLIARLVGSAADVEPNSVLLVLPLLLPAAYAVLLDAKELNTEKSDDGVFTLLAMGSVLLTLALVAVSLGHFENATSDDDLLGVLMVPGLLVLTALIAVGRRSGDTSRPRGHPGSQIPG